MLMHPGKWAVMAEFQIGQEVMLKIGPYTIESLNAGAVRLRDGEGEILQTTYPITMLCPVEPSRKREGDFGAERGVEGTRKRLKNSVHGDPLKKTDLNDPKGLGEAIGKNHQKERFQQRNSHGDEDDKVSMEGKVQKRGNNDLKEVIKYLQAKSTATEYYPSYVCTALLKCNFRKQCKTFQLLENGALTYIGKNGQEKREVILCTKRRKTLIAELHTGNNKKHRGRTATNNALKDSFYWPNMYIDVLFDW